MAGYYAERLSAERLRRCYEIATPRVRRYLESEILHALQWIRPGDRVLELGCGYGRLFPLLLEKAGGVTGIDNSMDNLRFGRGLLGPDPRIRWYGMDAAHLAFADGTFDRVLCLQNGISAFHTDPRRLIREAVRVTAPGGMALFSSYAASFWEDRLEWFRLQSREGLLGVIDEERTGKGIIVCRDGFRATTIGPDEFRVLTDDLQASVRILEVDGSSVFCEVSVPRASAAPRS
jgi:2-polyprenyl-6-hydroxyphenyl methylase/3-demethylubiquinone-9 3-methyltransferase